MVLEKDAKDRLDRSCEKVKKCTRSQGRKENPAYRKTGLVTYGIATALQNAVFNERMGGKTTNKT